MLALLLFLLLLWVIAGIVGFFVHALFWLFIVACVLIVLTLAAGAFGRGRMAARRHR